MGLYAAKLGRRVLMRVGGAVIYFTGRFYWLDSLLSLIIGVVLGIAALRLLVAVVRAVRRGTPSTSTTTDRNRCNRHD